MQTILYVEGCEKYEGNDLLAICADTEGGLVDARKIALAHLRQYESVRIHRAQLGIDFLAIHDTREMLEEY